MKNILVVLVLFCLISCEEGVGNLNHRMKYSKEEFAKKFVENLRDSNMVEIKEQLPEPLEYERLLVLWSGKESQGHKTSASFYGVENYKHLRRWRGQMKREPFEIIKVIWGNKIEPMGPYRLHRGVYQLVRFPNGKEEKIQIFKSVLEKEGKFMPWSIVDTRN